MALIGFIGVGNMGRPMALNLLGAGHRLRVFDVVPEAVAALAPHGAEPTSSAGGAAEGVEAVVTMLPEGSHVRAVYLSEGGVLARAAPGTLLVDCSTIDIETARHVNLKAADRGLEVLDAPVSGGVGGAEAGTLTFMVGGSEPGFARARPLLEAMGKAVIHAGPSGNGQAAKMCNNMILGVSMIAVSEAFVLAERLGLDAETLFAISSRSSGQCWSLTSYCPVPGPVPASPANRDYQAGFTAAMMAKDLRLAQQAALGSGAATPLGAGACQLYALLEAAGHGGLDFSGIIKMIGGKL